MNQGQYTITVDAAVSRMVSKDAGKTSYDAGSCALDIPNNKTLTQHHDKLREMGVRELGLFGSYRQDTARPDSDMDFLVTLEHPTFDSYMDLKFWLEDTFTCRIDLVLYHQAPYSRPHAE